MRLTRITLLLLALVMGLGFYQLVAYLFEDVDAQTFQATEEVMVDTAHILAGVLETEMTDGSDDAVAKSVLAQGLSSAQKHQFEAKVHSLVKTEIGMNFYVCNSAGIVIYDSADSSRIGKNYSEMNDVLLTLQGKYGARSSRIDEHNSASSILYVAAPVRQSGVIAGSLSVYKPQSDVHQFISHRKRDIVTACLLIGGGIILFTLAVFVWLFRPVGQLTEYAKSVSRGERLPLPNLGKGREVNTLGRALHGMRETLEGRRYVEKYVTALTHELKSPLAAIRGAAELLEEDMPPEQRSKFLANIRRETRRSESLVSNLLVLSELEGKPHLENQQNIDLAQLCRESCDELKPRLANKKLQIETELPDSLTLQGDRMVLKLALVNLLENAISFSPDGGTIFVSLKQTEESVKLSVTDQGPGVPDYAIERVFDHFYSLPRPKEGVKHSGLGLSLVQEAAKLHGGSVQLENTTPNGCRAVMEFRPFVS